MVACPLTDPRLPSGGTREGRPDEGNPAGSPDLLRALARPRDAGARLAGFHARGAHHRSVHHDPHRRGRAPRARRIPPASRGRAGTRPGPDAPRDRRLESGRHSPASGDLVPAGCGGRTRHGRTPRGDAARRGRLPEARARRGRRVERTQPEGGLRGRESAAGRLPVPGGRRAGCGRRSGAAERPLSGCRHALVDTRPERSRIARGARRPVRGRAQPSEGGGRPGTGVRHARGEPPASPRARRRRSAGGGPAHCAQTLPPT